MMRVWVLLIGFLANFGLASFGLTGAAIAQDQAWLQIEAQPSLAKAEERASAYSAAFPDVAGFQTRSGWYAIVLGPYEPAEAAAKMLNLKSENLIARDSYITDGTDHREQFWPAAGTVPADPVDPASDEAIAAPVEVEPVVVAEPEETVKQARAAEAELSKDERMMIQRALAWYGYYASTIDGAIGPGTRNSMAAWQEGNGFEGTGVLTTHQRGTLVANYNADQAEFGFQSITEAEAGIEITLPMSLVKFDRYEPPFVHFVEKDGSGLQVMLISEPGDQQALAGLYDILQTLEVVPAAGEREKAERSFVINGESADLQSYAFAEAKDGMVKGYLVVWKAKDAERMARILPALKSTFRAVGAKSLDPGLVPMEDAARAGLLAGLEVRRPKLSRSGFFLDTTGRVLTTVEAVDRCARVTIDHDTEATVTLSDAASGLAVLTPNAVLAPPAVAGVAVAAPRPGTELAVPGYSYEDRLPAPALTFGTYEEATGLNGEADLARLSIPALPGDAGAAVLDPSGAVAGMLLPAGSGDRLLPEGVAFALSAEAIMSKLSAAGVVVTKAPAGAAAATPDALNAQALGMTVLVSCWE